MIFGWLDNAYVCIWTRLPHIGSFSTVYFRKTWLNADSANACSILLSKLISRWKMWTNWNSCVYSSRVGIVWRRLWTSRLRKFWEVCATAHWITGNFNRVRRIAKSGYRSRNVCPSIVRHSAQNKSAPTGWVFMLDNWDHKHTLIVVNNYCLSTATMVTPTRISISLQYITYLAQQRHNSLNYSAVALRPCIYIYRVLYTLSPNFAYFCTRPTKAQAGILQAVTKKAWACSRTTLCKWAG